jgi:hypothetical protein
VNNNFKQKQKGAALLVLFLVIFTVTSTVFLAGLNNNAPNLRRESNIREEMALAKEALMSYALHYPDIYPGDAAGPGRFPCTDSSNNGSEDVACVVSGARLPESIDIESGSPFQINNTYSGNDRQFWYFISPAFDNSASIVNTTVTGGYTLDGQADDIVAVIISPGEQLSWQDRISGSTSNTNYLEAGNQSGGNFINSYATDPENFNDHVLGITKTELMSLSVLRVAEQLKVELNAYYDASPIKYRWNNGWLYGHSYPRDGWTWTPSGGYVIENYETSGFTNALSSVSPPWFNNDEWDTLSNYAYNYSTNVATFSFDNCAITFSLNYGSNLALSQKNC